MLRRTTFVTGVTTSSLQNNTLSYSWAHRAQRVDHGAGAYECSHFYHTSGACTMVFTPAGLYAWFDDTYVGSDAVQRG